ncbi:MAG TPA: SCO family protein, partial [Burkholderiaceae bacterium]
MLANVCVLVGTALIAGAAHGAPPVPPAAAAVTAPLPSDSIYQLAVPLTDQNGRTFKLDERRGQPVLVSMF